MQLSKFILAASCVPIFVTAGYALAVYKRLGPQLKAFVWFVFICGFLQSISLTLWFFKQNNIAVLHVLVVLGFLSLARFYKVVSQDYINPKIMTGLGIAFTCFTVFNSLFIQPLYTFNSYALTVESLLIVILSLSTYTLLLNEVVKEKMKDLKSLNWINSGLFIYYASNLLIFYFGKMITSTAFSVQFNRHVWIIHSFFSVIMYTCFFIGLWKRSKN